MTPIEELPCNRCGSKMEFSGILHKISNSSEFLYHCKCGNEPIINELVNGDGTPMNDFPKNPLKEKWDKLYPPTPMPQFCQVCDGYSCIYCGRCPKGSLWEVPEEDREIWEKYMQEVREYNRTHNNF